METKPNLGLFLTTQTKKGAAVVENHSVSDYVDIEIIRPEATAFALLGVLPAYTLNLEQVDFHYYTLLRQWHPDIHANSAPPMQQNARMMTAWVNRAYDRLKDPLYRAKTLIIIAGGKTPDEKNFSHVLQQVFVWQEDHSDGKLSQENLIDLFSTYETNFEKAWIERSIDRMQENYIYLLYLHKMKEKNAL